ncbi:hypothetical protein [uncultured Ruegeria sp.]|nr:hypothetical protein [uncultured Ruegeria sp.]
MSTNFLVVKPDFTIHEVKTAPFESDAYLTRWPDGLKKMGVRDVRE